MRWSGTIHHPLYYYLVNPYQSKQNPFPTRFPPSKNEPIEYSNQIIGKEFPFFSIIFPFILLAIFGKLPAKFWALYLGSPYTNMSYGFFSQVFMLCSHIYRNTSGTHPPTTHFYRFGNTIPLLASLGQWPYFKIQFLSHKCVLCRAHTATKFMQKCGKCMVI